MRPSGTYSEVTAGCGTDVVWLIVRVENDHCANSHLDAGENLALGHCSSYPWLPWAFPSTPLTSKVSLAEQPANTHGHSDWHRALGTILWVSDTSATPASTTQWLITRVIGSVTNPPRIQELHEQDWANDSAATTLQQDRRFQGKKSKLPQYVDVFLHAKL